MYLVIIISKIWWRRRRLSSVEGKSSRSRRENTRNKMVILKIQSKYLRHFYNVFNKRQIRQFFQVNTAYSMFKSQMKCSLICEGSIWDGGWITASILNASYILCPLLHVTSCSSFRYLWNETVTILILPMWKLFELNMPYEVSSSLIFKPLKSDRILLSKSPVKAPFIIQIKAKLLCWKGEGWQEAPFIFQSSLGSISATSCWTYLRIFHSRNEETEV